MLIPSPLSVSFPKFWVMRSAKGSITMISIVTNFSYTSATTRIFVIVVLTVVSQANTTPEMLATNSLTKCRQSKMCDLVISPLTWILILCLISILTKHG